MERRGQFDCLTQLMSIPAMILNAITSCLPGILGGTIIGTFGTQTLMFPTIAVSNPLALSSAIVTVSTVLLLMSKLK